MHNVCERCNEDLLVTTQQDKNILELTNHDENMESQEKGAGSKETTPSSDLRFSKNYLEYQ